MIKLSLESFLRPPRLPVYVFANINSMRVLAIQLTKSRSWMTHTLFPWQEESFFPVLRVLLPALDKDRGAYGVKERKLADLYIRILGIKKEAPDAVKLINYRWEPDLEQLEETWYTWVSYG